MDRLVQAIVLVEDLEVARRTMEQRGFSVEEGGRHPGRGTANVIVPLGEQYLEFLAVVDEAEARSSAQGRPVLDALSRRGPGLARWSVEPSNIDAVAERLGMVAERRQRIRPDGVAIRWTAVGVDAAWERPWRSAFMAWDDERFHPARRVRDHPNGATGITRLDVVTPEHETLAAWLGGPLPDGVRTHSGERPGPEAAYVATRTGPLKIC